jgi:filamentous hemagglutinin family protein
MRKRVINNALTCYFRQASTLAMLLLVWPIQFRVQANPTGGTVTQGTATVNSSGSQLTINQTSATAFINWQSFNIGAGQTTTFVQPSSSSVTWNQINDPNASTINGNLNANGYVILQNPNGFTVGGQAAITAHGLIMTTASTPPINLSSGGAWSFNTPPPTAKIINYGQINITGGGSAFLIASDIENNGTISAPGGRIGLYAGENVLVSTSPDGRGLSAEVTLPQGSVDNEGKLIADAGSIAAQARVVNQGGLIQANSVKNVNGTIELVASDAVNLGASSDIEAHGDNSEANTGASPGGSVTIKSDNNFSDQIGSTINISGGAQGGNGGQVEISAPQMSAINSSINGQAAADFVNGQLTIDPLNIQLVSSGGNGTSTEYSSGTVGSSDAPTTGILTLNVNSFASTLSQINLQAVNNIELSTVWTLIDPGVASTLNLTAGNNIILDDGAAIKGGNHWSVNLSAGTGFVPTLLQPTPTSGNDGIYLNGSSYIQTQNGNINLWAASEVIVNSGAIRTLNGGNIDVTAEYGNVNSGTSVSGFNYSASAPYYTPVSTLGGISTAAGGNVTINAGGDVISFPTTTPAAGDPGTGTFGSEPGNVTITAGGSVYGHFVEVNGTGTINASGNIGTSTENVALSLVKGSWNLNAGWDPLTQTVQSGIGDIYLQEVRNPNGVFDNVTVYNIHTHRTAPSTGNHLFDYDPQAAVTLTAGNGVYLTGSDLPRPNDPVPMLMPPTLIINAGPGGVTLQTPTAIDGSSQPLTLLDYDITLFPSAYGNLQITTTDGGGLSGGNDNGTAPVLLMSDSNPTQQWFNTASGGYSGPLPFGPQDHASVPAELNNDNPVEIDIDGNMENVTLQVCKLAQIKVGGDMTGCSFYGENLNAGDVTSIKVGGQIYYSSSFTSVTLDQAFMDLFQLSQTLLSSGETYLPRGTADNWYTILGLAINPNLLPTQSLLGTPSSQLSSILAGALMFPSFYVTGFLDYNPNTQKLTAAGPLPSNLYTDLESPYLYLVRYGIDGYPLLDSYGHFEIDKISWVPVNSANASQISLLYNNSNGYNGYNNGQPAPPLIGGGALVVGGTGEFDVTASSINLGNSDGILSVGNGGTPANPFLGEVSYSFLTPYITSGATINVTADTLEMPSSIIAALGGGNVNVTCNGVIPGSSTPNRPGIGVSMDLGSPDLLDFEAVIMGDSNLGLGIYTSGGGDVNVTAYGTINIDTSRIATFNGGNVNITSLTGDVNAGSGGMIAVPIQAFPLTATLSSPYEYVFANGIVADTLQPESDGSLVPGAATLPGNITVTTPKGSIYASLGGILQETLGGTLLPGPAITLEAGTPGAGGWGSSDPPLYGPPQDGVGDITLDNSGVIGGTVNVQATGKVTGLVISSQNANVTGQSLGSLTVLAGGTANVSAQSGSGSGITIIGGQGVNASGIGSGATLLGQNVSVNGGAAQSTLGSSASATSTSQSAAGQASSEAQQQVAGNGNGNDDEKKKKSLLHYISRVTVILSAVLPPH